MVTQNSNKKIIFTRSVSSILDEILKKYKLEKNEDDFLDILEQGGDLPDEIILDAVTEVAQGRIPQKDLSSILQKRLGVSKPQANKLTKDIEEKLLPLTEEVSEEETLKEKEKVLEEKEMLKGDKEPIIREPIEETPASEAEETTPSEQPPVEQLPQKEKRVKPVGPEKSEKPSKEDTYREPIE